VKGFCEHGNEASDSLKYCKTRDCEVILPFEDIAL
jgi:hypothetical protein